MESLELLSAAGGADGAVEFGASAMIFRLSDGGQSVRNRCSCVEAVPRGTHLSVYTRIYRQFATYTLSAAKKRVYYAYIAVYTHRVPRISH